MNHLIMRQRQDKVFCQAIHKREGQFVEVKAAIDWILAVKIQRIVHPTHVPLIVKAQRAILDSTGNLHASRAFLRDP